MQNKIYPKDMYVEANGLRLHYLDWGNKGADTLVLLHGLQDCSRSWDFFASVMSIKYRVLTLDHRGHGDSDWADPSHYQLVDYVSDIEALFDKENLKDVILVGHSAGGRNAFMYAVENISNIKALIIVDIDPDGINIESQLMFRKYNSESDHWNSFDLVIERLRMRQPLSSEHMLQHQALYMTKQDSNGVFMWKRDRRLLHNYERPDLWNYWSQITCPTLIIRGRQSKLLTHEVGVRMFETLVQGRLVELEGGGHWFYQEAPEAFEASVRWFLESLVN